MPYGTYTFDSGAHEDFRCGPHQGGWRYRTAGLELALDAAGRQRRVEFRADGRVLRGGVIGTETLWVRDGRERAVLAAGFAGDSPALLLAATRLLDLTPGDRIRLHLILVTGPALATREVDQGWELIAPHHYRLTHLDTGESGDVHLQDGMILSAPGVHLTALAP